MKRRLIQLILLVIVWLLVGCSDQPSLTPTTTTATAIQPTETPEPTKVLPPPTPTEGRPAWLPTTPDNPTIVQITDTTEWRNVNPVWSPDGSQIAFLSNRECVKQYDDDEWEMKSRCWEWDLYLINVDGSNEIRLTDVQFRDLQSMAWLRWFPDGERIAFTYSKYLDLPFERVLSFSLDKAKKTPLGLEDMEVLVDEGEEYQVGSFEWSPDGKQYAYDYSDFRYYPDTTWTLVIIDEESGEEVFRKTKAGDTMCSIGAWSPTGEGILISCRESKYDPHIDWIDLRGGTEQLLIEKGITPTWSPDGKWIAFYSTEIHGLELFHVESGEIIPFTSPNYDLRAFEWFWSPDGKWLAFSRLVETDVATWDIFLLDMSWLEMEWEE